ncbi:MAG: WXG100 family type VII secretion target [Planctomycetota bacterium]
MSQAIVDPGELRKFAKDLARFNRDLESLVGAVHGRMRNLENTWRDQEQRKFSDAFNDTVRMLARFVDQSEQHVAFLNKKAELAEEYLKGR